MRMSWLLALVLMQDAQSFADKVRAAMAGSLDQQRASVRKEAKSAGAAIIPFAEQERPIVWGLGTPACEPIREPQLGQMIDAAAESNGVSSTVVREVARQESGFRPCVISPKGAQGLMQLMPATQVHLQVSDPFDAQESLQAGSKLLKELLDRYNGDITKALSAYNAGAGRVDKAGGIPPIPETQKYVSNILSRILQ
jgi:soluble lytic murein transglycosylase-like protein